MARIAIVHERFTEWGGSEAVVEALHEMWPEAPIYAALVDHEILPASLRSADVRPSRLQRRYHGGTGYARFLPRIPSAFAALDLRDFDAVVTSHHAFANRIRPPREVPVLSYTHTPARWMWDAAMRRDERGSWLGRMALGTFAATQRQSDRSAAARTRTIVANSSCVADRVNRWWRRGAQVVHPPVNIAKYTVDPGVPRSDFFLLAGRLVPYKQPLVAVAAAIRAGVPLVVAGDGRQRAAVEKMARGHRHIEVLGRVDDDTLLDLYRRCRALVFPGEEDFGIVPVEAQACGSPVIALAAGGAAETVIEGVTGTLVPDTGDRVANLAGAIQRFDGSGFDARSLREHAEHFSPERFRREMEDALDGVLVDG